MIDHLQALEEHPLERDRESGRIPPRPAGAGLR